MTRNPDWGHSAHHSTLACRALTFSRAPTLTGLMSMVGLVNYTITRDQGGHARPYIGQVCALVQWHGGHVATRLLFA